MARLLRDLVRRPSSNRFFTSLTHQNPSNPATPLRLHQKIVSLTKFNLGDRLNLNPSNEGLGAAGEIAHFTKSQIYPSFSFGFSLHPVSSSGSGPYQLMGPGGADLEHPGMMWADSVKKKRKRKMNKHKYKKLRKRLRRKTKT